MGLPFMTRLIQCLRGRVTVKTPDIIIGNSLYSLSLLILILGNFEELVKLLIFLKIVKIIEGHILKNQSSVSRPVAKNERHKLFQIDLDQFVMPIANQGSDGIKQQEIATLSITNIHVDYCLQTSFEVNANIESLKLLTLNNGKLNYNLIILLGNADKKDLHEISDLLGNCTSDFFLKQTTEKCLDLKISGSSKDNVIGIKSEIGFIYFMHDINVIFSIYLAVLHKINVTR